nr:helix-turn-helix domain-containing protein [Polycladospora coralii]
MNPISSSIGETIREHRRKLGMNQQQLCKGICTQAYLSQIENGKSIANVYILQQLANKVGILIEEITSNQFEQMYISEFYSQVRENTMRGHLDFVLSTIIGEETNPLLSAEEHQSFIAWHKSIYAYKEEKNYQKSLHYLNKARLYKEDHDITCKIDLEMMHTKANIFLEEGQLEKSIEIYQLLLGIKKKLPFQRCKLVHIRLHYNYALSLYLTGKHINSLTLCNEAIMYCQKFFMNYRLADVYLLKSMNLFKLGRFKASDSFKKKAKLLFEAQDEVEKAERADCSVGLVLLEAIE